MVMTIIALQVMFLIMLFPVQQETLKLIGSPEQLGCTVAVSFNCYPLDLLDCRDKFPTHAAMRGPIEAWFEAPLLYVAIRVQHCIYKGHGWP